MAINPLNATIPQPQVPFLTPAGGVSREWLYYMLALLARTGGQAGISAAILQAQINSLFVEYAMVDEPEPPNISALTVDGLMGDAPDARSIWFALLALADETPPAPLNPILASLMVA